MESDIVEQLREEGFVTHMARLPRESKILHAAADEIERLRKERNEARLQTGRILNEIDCRIEHGAESNGHLEAIYRMFKDNTDDR